MFCKTAWLVFFTLTDLTVYTISIKTEEYMLTKKRIYILLTAVLALLIFAAAVLGIYYGVLSQRGEDYDEALGELDAKIGQYDEKTIVLSGTSVARAKKLAREFNAELRISENGRFAALTLPEGVTVRDVYSDRDNMKYLSEMSLDYKVKLADTSIIQGTSRPDYEVLDTDYEKQTYLDYLNFGRVWGSFRGNGVKIAVIDTGIDTDHPEFAGRISEDSYNATLGKAVKDNILADGSYDWSLIEDEYGHGTMVSGVIAAGMNGEGTVGIAPEATVITVKVEADDTGAMKQSDLIFGIYYAIEAGAQVINMSFGGYAPENNYADAISLAYEKDIILVASAGNDSTSSIHWPSADENVIAVGALEADGWGLAGYSNYGDNTDVVAPGTVYTTVMGGGYDTVNGTSFSAPIVAGAMGLLRNRDSWSENNEIIPLLYASARDLGDVGRDFKFGYGAVDIAALVYETRYTVTYDMMTDELDDMSETVIADHTLQHAPIPERLYSVFDGWYYDPYYTTEYTFGVDVISSDITLYARWSGEDDGVPFTYNTLRDGTVEITSYTGRRRYITVPEYVDGRAVSAIADGAFSGERELRQIILPSGIRKIGANAFSQCTSLTEITIPSAVTEIGYGAFSECVRLRSLNFQENSNLKTVLDFAFSSCASLTELVIPKSVEEINGSAFFGTSGLTSITVEEGSAHFISEGGVLFNKTKSTLVAYPSGRGGDYALPSGTDTVGKYAFAYTLAQAVSLGSVSTIGEYAFTHARITSVTLPDTLVSLGDSAFYVAESLSEASIGKGLEKIPNSAFYMTSVKSVKIPASVTDIGSSAFAAAPLSELVFEAGSQLRNIGAGAFSGADLTSVTLPDTVATVGSYAFSGNIRLSQVNFGEQSCLNAIGAYAFSHTISLTSVSLPRELEKIGDHAFANSGIFGVVSLPDGISYFGAGAFSFCAVDAFVMSENNGSYSVVDGVLFDKTYGTLVAYPAARTGASYTVPVYTASIGSYAFAGASELTELQLGNIVELKPNALSAMSGLKRLALPYSLVTIGAGAFSENNALTEIYFPYGSSIKTLGEYAISGCGINYFTVPASVERIEPNAFYNLPTLYGVTFEENSKLTVLEARTFYECELLYTIYFSPGSSLCELKPYALDGLSRLESINLEETKLRVIGDFGMRFCKGLRTVTLPNTLEKIGSYAFYACTGISEIIIPKSVNYIGSYAFLGTEDITVYFVSDVLPDTLLEDWDRGIKSYSVGTAEVVTDGDYKYSVSQDGAVSILGYTGSDRVIDLTALKLPDGAYIKTIGGSVFAGIEIEEIILPDTLVTIQNKAFYKTGLKSIVIPASVEFIGREAFFGTPIESLVFTEGARIERIEQSAFENTSRLTAVALPNSLAELGRYSFRQSGIRSIAFEDGILLTEISEEAFYGTDITEVKIPDGVTKICDGAFRETASLAKIEYGTGDIIFGSNAFYMSGLSEIYIGKNVTLIEEFALTALTNLTSFEVDPNHPSYKSVGGMLYTKDGRKIISAPAGMSGVVTLAEGTEEIGFGAFERSKIEAIVFPEKSNILSIGYRAFFRAEALKKIEIPESVVSIDYYAFAYCRSLTDVTFGDGSRLSGVYEGAFYDCRALSEISLPDTVAEISDFAFYACGSLTRMPISDTSSIRGVYSYAFAYTSITELKLHPTVTDLGEYAFLGASLKSARISSEREKELVIGIGVFEANNELEEITLPFIGAYLDDGEHTWLSYIFGAGGYKATATYIPASLKRVTINGSQSFLGENAFANIEGLEEINLPDTVSAVYGGAFENTSAKYELTAEEITVMLSYGKGYVGVIEIPDGTESVQGFGYFKYVTEFILPDSATEIGYMAFIGCESLTTVRIPDGVTLIDSYAFASCSSLESIKMPAELVTIGQDAFYGCSSLKELTLPKKLTSIHEWAFSYCEALEKITNNSDMELVFGAGVAEYAKIIIDKQGVEHKRPLSTDYPGIEDDILTDDGLRFDYSEGGEYTLVGYLGTSDSVTLPKTILDSAYTISCVEGIVNLTVPKDFGVISSGAFCDSKTLKSVVIEGGETVIEIGAFGGCENLLSVFIGEGVEYIGTSAFIDCSAIEAIRLPDSLTYLGAEAFWGCTSLKSVNLPSGLTGIEDRTFMDCESLIEIEIPGGIRYIGGYAFDGCSSLLRVGLSEGLEYINAYSFQNCVSLTSLELPSTVYSLTSEAFLGSDTVIRVSAENPTYKEKDGIIYGYDSSSGEDVLTSIAYVPKGITEIVIPKNVEVGSGAFKGHTGLRRVAFEQGYNCDTIYGSAFEGCVALKEITIPDSVTVIGSNAFSGCISLEEITLSKNLRYIDDDMMAGCISIKKIELPNTVEYIGKYAFGGCTQLSEIKIPTAITKISDYAFKGCTSLSSVSLPSGLRIIGEGAFENCASLKMISLPDGLEEIGAYAFMESGIEKLYIPDGVDTIAYRTFYKCNMLMSVRLPDTLVGIYADAFYGSSLESIEIPEGVLAIGSSAFEECGSLRLVTFKKGPETIGQRAFMNCSSLELAIIPSTVISLEANVFSGCTSLTELVIPGSVNEIPSYFATGCHGIKSLVIGEGVERIGYCAFENAYKIESITLPSTIKAIEDDAFLGCEGLFAIYNNSDLAIGFNYGEFGGISNYAYVIHEKDGTVKNKTNDSGEIIELIETPDGFVFEKVGEEYSLIRYTGTEETVTVPLTVNGAKYTVNGLHGATNVIIPEGYTSATNYVYFSNNYTVKSIEICDGVSCYLLIYGCSSLERLTVGNGISSFGMFSGCYSLKSISFGENVTSIQAGAFDDTAYFKDESNWEGGGLYLNGCLVAIKETVEYFELKDGTRLVASGLFDNCYRLRYLKVGQISNYSLGGLTNLECLALTYIPRNGIRYLFGTVPETLKSVVLSKGVKMGNSPFYGIKDITVFVEDEKADLGWDENYGNWHNGNTVIYGDRWIWVHFLDESGNTLFIQPQSNSQVIRIPYIAPTYDDRYVYTVLGFDTDGDGNADPVPATSTVDIIARAVMARTAREYEVKFVDKDGVTPLYTYRLPYGAKIPTPDAPTRRGYTFLGWLGYPEDNTVVGDLTVSSVWRHDGYGHNYGAPVWTPPTCTEEGGYRRTCVICGEHYTTGTVDKTGHAYTVTVVPPSCLTVGYDLYSCTCGDSYKENYKDPTGHSFGGWTEVSTPSCTALGKAERVCSTCHEAEEVTLAMTAHIYQKSITREATCQTEGEITYVCSCSDKVIEKTPTSKHRFERVYESDEQFAAYQAILGSLYYANDGSRYCLVCSDCGYLETGSEVNLYATLASVNSTCLHTLGDWQVIDGGGCTLNEISGRLCTLCGKTVEARISSLAEGHNLGAWVAPTEPDCENDGNVGYYECGICHTYFDGEHNKLDTVTTEKLGHDFGDWQETVAPGCITNGEETGKCSRCDKTDTRPTEPIGHSFIPTVTPPDCNNDGYTTHDCSRCDEWYVDSYVDALGHSYVPTLTPPTCEENGYTTHNCTRCEDWYVDSYVDALGHNFGDWYTTDEPDCYNSGEQRRDCTRCDKFETRVTDALGHEYTQTLHQPTCTESGYTLHECIRCDEEYKDSFLNPLNHLFGPWYETKEPKCEEIGERRRDCTRCSHYEVEEVAATNHNYTEKTVPPTCTEEGYTIHTCSSCGDEYSDTFVLPLGHKFGDWYELTHSDCNNGGEDRRDCIRCDAYDTVKKQPLGHDYDIVEITYPSCEAGGFTTYKCKMCSSTTVGDYTDKLEHEYGEWRETTHPSCDAEGERARYCKHCTDLETEAIPPLGHAYQLEIVGPTCTEPGRLVYTCLLCGKVTTTNGEAAVGHVYDDGGSVCKTCGAKRENGGKLESGAVIAISAGSVAAAGAGGFSLFWFVIKKKKLIDLIALFKK